jgi:drug/metabolite transporter (DMT)-like permease
MHWISLTLLSAFFLATADTLSKRYLSHYRPGELVLVRFGVSGVLLLPLLLWQPWPALSPVFWGWIAIALPLELLAMWLYMQAIRSSPLSLTLPYLAFTPAFNTLTGYVVLGETITWSGFSGILLIVFGAWLLNVNPAQNGSGLNILAPFRTITQERGSRLMLIVAAIYSLTSVTSKGALLHVTPAFNTLTGYVVLGETITWAGFSGILLIVFGAWLLNVNSAQSGFWLNILTPFRAITRERGSRLMLIVAAIYSLTSVTSKGALLHVTPAFFGPFYFVILGATSLLLFASRDVSSWRALGRHPWAHLSIGVCMGGMVIAHFYAIEHIEVAYMIAVKRTSLLFGMLYGAWLFKETGLLKNMLAGVLMVLGVFFIVV